MLSAGCNGNRNILWWTDHVGGALYNLNRIYSTEANPSHGPLGAANNTDGRAGGRVNFGGAQSEYSVNTHKLIRWWRRLKPFKQEMTDLKRRISRNIGGFDPLHHSLTRTFVQFPFLNNEEFTKWQITTDRSLNQGYSWAEFVRSNSDAGGCAKVVEPGNYFNPISEDRKFNHDNSRKNNNNDNEIINSKEIELNSNRITENHPFNYTYPSAGYRGDGRVYRINFANAYDWDIYWYNTHRFALYTRGGPYWQIAKIPLSKFYMTERGLIHTNQQPVDLSNIRLLSFTLMDDIEGPFSLELDYVKFYRDTQHKELFAYEQYDATGIIT